jgi:hypothetical protein
MPTQSHPHLHGRPFGSALLFVSDFNAWLRGSNLHFPVPILDDGDYFQIEALLVKVELHAGSISDEEAAAVVAADPFLAADPMASLNPRWLVGAEAHRKWRVRITDAVIAGELAPLDFGSMLPISIPGIETAPASTGSSDEGISAALADYFDLPAHPPLILPDALEGTVRRVFRPSPFGAGYWMDLSPEVRRDVAAKWDSEHTEEAIALEQADATAAFAESANNGAAINWRYWAEQMPTWTSAQASRLMCALDPDVFEDLASRPNRSDPSQLTLNAKKIQRLADAQHIGELSPAEWLAWADKHKLRVHVGLRVEVGRQESLLASKDAPRSTHSRAPIAEPSKASVHKINGREPAIMSAEIERAKGNAPTPPTVASVWGELTKLAEGKFGVMIGFSTDGIQYRGRKYQSSGDLDIFTQRNLRERMTREAARKRTEPH